MTDPHNIGRCFICGGRVRPGRWRTYHLPDPYGRTLLCGTACAEILGQWIAAGIRQGLKWQREAVNK